MSVLKGFNSSAGGVLVLKRFTYARMYVYEKRDLLKGFSWVDPAKIVKRSKKHKKKA